MKSDRLLRSTLTMLALALSPLAAVARESSSPAPAPDKSVQSSSEVVIFAGGCFWGVQGVFQHVNGVIGATSGYSGGSAATAYYPMVSSGATGHAESVRVEFDPRKVSFGELLRIYFSVAHNPTELNRQGPDTGTQYRSAIWYTSAAQQKTTLAYVAQLDKAHAFHGPIVTQVQPFKAFYAAEAYHQNYATLHPDDPYIAYNDQPKIARLKQLYPADYRAEPVLVGH